MDIIKTIRAEIERLKGICAAQIKVNPGQTFPFVMEMTGYDKLLSFLSTLESEKPINPSGSSEIPNDLEEAAGEYEKKHIYQRYDGGGLTPEYDATLAEAFIAGHNLYKEQILKEAVAVEVVGDKRDLRLIDSTLRCLFNAKRGDWLKIIIVKED